MLRLIERSRVVDPKLRSVLEHAVEEFGGDAKLVEFAFQPAGFVFFAPSGRRYIWDARIDNNWRESEVLDFVRRERRMRDGESD